MQGSYNGFSLCYLQTTASLRQLSAREVLQLALLKNLYIITFLIFFLSISTFNLRKI